MTSISFPYILITAGVWGCTSGLLNPEVHFLVFDDRLADRFKLSLIKVQEAKKKSYER